MPEEIAEKHCCCEAGFLASGKVDPYCRHDVIAQVIAEERDRMVMYAAGMTVDPERTARCEIHPDIPFDRFNEKVKTAAHTTAQAIAFGIERGGESYFFETEVSP